MKKLKNLKFLFDHLIAANRTCYAAVSPYKYFYGSFSFFNLHLIHCLPKVGLHALYMLNSVLFANLYSSMGKGLRKKSLNEEQTFDF